MRGIFLLGDGTCGQSQAADLLSQQHRKNGTLHIINGNFFKKYDYTEARFRLKEQFAQVGPKTKMIIIDDFPLYHIFELEQFLIPKEIVADAYGRLPRLISPEVIVTCDFPYFKLPVRGDTLRRFTFFTCHQVNERDISMTMHQPIIEEPINSKIKFKAY